MAFEEGCSAGVGAGRGTGRCKPGLAWLARPQQQFFEAPSPKLRPAAVPAPGSQTTPRSLFLVPDDDDADADADSEPRPTSPRRSRGRDAPDQHVPPSFCLLSRTRTSPIMSFGGQTPTIIVLKEGERTPPPLRGRPPPGCRLLDELAYNLSSTQG